jgi:hypothetical protein
MASVPPLETPPVSKSARIWGSPGSQGSAEVGDFGDRTGPQRRDDLIGESASGGGCLLVVDRAEPLVAVPGDGELPAGVAVGQAGVEAGELAGGEVLGAVAQESADLVERVVAVAAVTQLLLGCGGGPRPLRRCRGG